MRMCNRVNAPLYNKLLAYSRDKQSFHMPGHKFGTIADMQNINLSSLDNTEVVGMDNLYDARGIIRQAMELMADFYGSKDTLFLTNGSTAGILASILTICQDHDKLIVAKNCHHSVWSGLVLSGAIPIYVNPRYLSDRSILGEVTAESIGEALNTYPDAKGVLIVSPTYEGVISDIHAIAEVVHARDKILIVDEAHGAHFAALDDFPISSVQLGADLVINSMHKTLPALTQSALLHRCSDRVSYSQLVSSLRMIQTSSPSYMMMGLMDYIRCYILGHKTLLRENYINPLTETRQNLRRLKHLKLIDFKEDQYDISKIIISTLGSNIDGYQLAEILNDNYNIVAEAAFSPYIILMTTMADNKHTLMKLEEALIQIDTRLNSVSKTVEFKWNSSSEVIEGANLRQVYYAAKELLVIDKCEGKIAARHIMLYPPGIPLICIGEKIAKIHIELISSLKDKIQGIEILGEHIMLQVVK